MIKEFMASPKRFKKPDFSKIGSGTGVLRYAFGMYMGEKNTALKYYEDYKDYGGADATYIRNGIKISEDSVGFEVAELLRECNWDINDAEFHLRTAGEWRSKAHKQAFDLLTKFGKKIDFQTSYAAFYEVTLPNHSLSDLLTWEDEASPEELDRVALAFLNKTFDIDNLDPKLVEKLRDLDFDFDIEYENAEEMIDALFDDAYNNALEEDLVSYSVSDDHLREIWYQRARNDSHTVNMHDDDFIDAIEDKYLDALKMIVGEDLCVQNEFSNGDLYHALSHAFNQDYEDGEDNVLGKKLASDFLSKELGYVGYLAEAKFGDRGAQEKIIINEAVAETMRLVEQGADVVDEMDIEDDYGY